MGQSPCSAFTASCACPSTKAPSLHRYYPASSVPWAYPTSHTARPAPRGVPVRGHTPRPLGDPVLRLVFLGVHAVVFTPADVLTPQRSPVSRLGSEGLAAFPVFPAGRLPQSSFRGLNDVYGYYGLHPWQVPVGLSTPEASQCRYLHWPLRFLPAGTCLLAGRESHPLKHNAFSRRTEI